MKTRLLGFVFAFGLLLVPALASASPMDGTYLGGGIINNGFLNITLDPYTAVIGAELEQYGVDYTGAYLPSADLLATGPYGDLATNGFTFALEQPAEPLAIPSVIVFEGATDEFTGTGTLTFSDYNDTWGFMTAVISASGISSLFGSAAITVDGTLFKQTATPIPGAVWLLGTGLVGLLGVRKRLKRS